MDREEILNSKALKEMFCYLCDVIVSTYDNPQFYQDLIDSDSLQNGINKFCEFCNELKNFKNEEAYFQYLKSVKDDIISEIENDRIYQIIDEDCNFPWKRNQLFINKNNNKSFVQISFKDDGFVLLGMPFESWNKYISSKTWVKHIIHSKNFKQHLIQSINGYDYLAFDYASKIEKYLNQKLQLKPYFVDLTGIIYEVPVGGLGISLNELRNEVDNMFGDYGSICNVDYYLLSKLATTDICEKWGKTFREVEVFVRHTINH